jgi:hypothetical protein
MSEKEKQPEDQISLDLETPEASVEETAPIDDGPMLDWTVHPVRRNMWRSALVTAFIILVAIVVYWSTASNAFTVLALVVLLLSLAKFYFPTRYRLSQAGVAVKTTTQTLTKTWSQFRSFYPDKNGVLLSPFTRPTRMENFRGLYLMCRDNKDEVIVFVKERLQASKAEGDKA